MKPLGGGCLFLESFLVLVAHPGPWRSSMERPLASARWACPLRSLPSGLGLPEASRHRPSLWPGNQALTRDPCAPTLGTSQGLVQRSQEAVRNAPGLLWLVQPALGWGPLPSTAHGRRRALPPHTPLPPRRQALRSPDAGARPGQSPTHWAPRGWQTPADT